MTTVTESKVRLNIYKRLRDDKGKKPIPPTLAEKVASILPRHLIKNGMVNEGKRITIAKEGQKLIYQIAHALSWMNNANNHHGQQDRVIADKVIKSIMNDSTTADMLISHCTKFKSMRLKHIKTNWDSRILGKDWRLDIGNECVASEITSVAELRSYSKPLRNCLSNVKNSHSYIKSFVNGQTGFIIIKHRLKPITLIRYRKINNDIVEIKGYNNKNSIESRDGIIKVIAARDFSVNNCENTLNLGICDELISNLNHSHNFVIGICKCITAPGCVVLIFEGHSRLIRDKAGIHAEVSRGDSKLNADEYLDHDEVCNSPENSNDIRLLHALCRECPEFGKAAARAFYKAEDMFIWHWLGSGFGRPAPKASDIIKLMT